MRDGRGPGAWDRFAFGLHDGDSRYERAMTPVQRLLWRCFTWVLGIGAVGVALYQLAQGRWLAAALEGLLGLVVTCVFTHLREEIWLSAERVMIPGRPIRRVRLSDLISVDASHGEVIRLTYRTRIGPWSLGVGEEGLRLVDRQAFLEDLQARAEEALGRERTRQLFA